MRDRHNKAVFNLNYQDDIIKNIHKDNGILLELSDMLPKIINEIESLLTSVTNDGGSCEYGYQMLVKLFRLKEKIDAA